MYVRFFKRFMDFILSLCALIVLSPLLLLLIILGVVFMGGNPFFAQERPGKDEKIFKLIKFRSMNNKRDNNGELLSDERRLNKYGRFLRRSSMDELPELINILKGDMSIIGPRPLVPEYLSYYTDDEKHRHDVRPGLSGLAQVNGRSFISWEEIFKYDLEYINKITFWGDTQIVIDTIKKAFQRENIADMSETWQDEDGKLHCMVDGKEILVHSPLNIERAK